MSCITISERVSENTIQIILLCFLQKVAMEAKRYLYYYFFNQSHLTSVHAKSTRTYDIELSEPNTFNMTGQTCDTQYVGNITE